MSIQDPHTSIDERGRRAATALHDLLDADEVGPDTEAADGDSVVAFRPRRNPMPYVLAAAAAVVVVVAAVVISSGDDGPSPVASDPAGYLFPSVAPLGLDVVGGTVDLEAARTDGEVLFDGDVAIYAANRGMAAPSVAVLRIDNPDGMAEPLEGEAVTVQGVDATIGTDGLFQSGGAGDFTVAWTRPGHLVVVTTTGISRDEALVVAEAVSFDGDRPSVADGAVPDGLALQHRDRVSAVVPFGTAYALDGGGAGVVAFGDADGVDPATIVMSTGPGDQRRVDAVRPFLLDQVEVDVRGTTGIAGQPFEDTVVLTWLDGDNTVVRLLGFGGVTVDDLVAMAESLESATAADVEASIDAALGAVEANIPDDAALEIELEDGTFYVVIDMAGDSIEAGIQTNSTGGSVGTGFSDFNADPVGALVGSDDSRIYGVVGADIGRAVVIDNGTEVEVPLIEVPRFPYQAFVLHVSSADAELRLFDRAGNPVND